MIRLTSITCGLRHLLLPIFSKLRSCVQLPLKPCIYIRGGFFFIFFYFIFFLFPIQGAAHSALNIPLRKTHLQQQQNVLKWCKHIFYMNYSLLCLSHWSWQSLTMYCCKANCITAKFTKHLPYQKVVLGHH